MYAAFNKARWKKIERASTENRQEYCQPYTLLFIYFQLAKTLILYTWKKYITVANAKKNSSREIIKDIYGVKDGNVYEYGFAEALDEDDFNVKLQSLKDCWESFCPGFFDWFKKTRVSQFLESVIQTARIGYDSEALYYQNYI